MKAFNLFFFVILLFSSCYKDKGNYDYIEINEISIDGIDSLIRCDQMELIDIEVSLSGTQYDDPELFSYQWEVNQSVIATTKNLQVNANFPLGDQIARFVITDKKNGTKTFKNFTIRVSSASAGDGILVLSKHHGIGELSFKRLDREGQNFSANYYASIAGSILGVNPKKIHRNYGPEKINNNSGLLIEIDNRLKSLDDETLIEIAPNSFLDQHFFTGRGSVYPPAIPSFNVEGAWQVYLSSTPFGMPGHSKHLFVIADGKLFSDDMFQIPGMNVVLNVTRILKESPLGGALSPTMFFSEFAPTSLQDNKSSDFLFLYDSDHGQFLYTPLSGETINVLPNLHTSLGYNLFYATHTALKNYSIAVLNSGDVFKLLYLRLPTSNAELTTTPAEVVNTINVDAEIVNSISSFYTMRTEPSLYIATNDKVLQVNTRGLEDASQISVSSTILKLADYGYDPNAIITCMTFSRTENEIILGVSRYGDDKEGLGDELKGDVVVIDRNTRELIKKYEGVCGYPVDITIKYQKYLREGKENGTVVTDNLYF